MDLDSWLGQAAASLLPNNLFLSCNRGKSRLSDRQKFFRTNSPLSAQNSVASPVRQKSLQSKWRAKRRSGVSLAALGVRGTAQCGFAWEERLRPLASSKLEVAVPAKVKSSQAYRTSVRPKFPQLSRSSLVVSFPRENSSFSPKNQKLANPAPGTKRIASPFGWRRRPYSNQLQFHQGIDYGAPYGSEVVAVGNGIVTKVVKGCADFGNLFCGGQLGNWVEIDHGNGIIGTYGHLKYNSSTVQPGTRVRKNQPIAQVGSSGWSTGAHLDFRLKVNGKHEDPAQYVTDISP
ncbi:MAG: M23 family metallopeptidase [Cyanobacteria bacterium J06623_7]